MSVARAMQHGSNHDDDMLTARARLARPQRRHWWGRRRWWVRLDDPSEISFRRPGVDREDWVARTGAWCYLCEEPIATWSSRWPATARARLVVEAHRSQHLQGQLDLRPCTGED